MVEFAGEFAGGETLGSDPICGLGDDHQGRGNPQIPSGVRVLGLLRFFGVLQGV